MSLQSEDFGFERLLEGLHQLPEGTRGANAAGSGGGDGEPGGSSRENQAAERHQGIGNGGGAGSKKPRRLSDYLKSGADVENVLEKIEY